MQLDLIAYKTDSGIWAFDHPHQNTVAEALCNGTEDVIDVYYRELTGQPPVAGDRLKLQLDSEPMESWTTRLERLHFDQAGTTYLDPLSGMEVWLCPWLQGYFQERPQFLHVLVG